MSSAVASLVVDAESPLGSRVLSLLQLSTPVGPLSDSALRGRRVLLIDASQERANAVLSQGARHVVHVTQARAGLKDALPVAISTLAAHVYQESLLARLRHALRTGTFLTAAAQHSAAYVAQEDVAMVAALILAGEDERPTQLTLSGPTAYTHEQLCALLERVFGRRIRLSQVASHKLLDALIDSGMPDDEAHEAAQLDTSLLSRAFPVSHDVARSTGMLPLSISQLLKRERSWMLRPVAAARPAARAGEQQATPLGAARS